MAEIVTEVVLAIGMVVTAKVALVLLAAIVTVDGTAAANVLLLESVNVAPPAGAGPLSVTVPVEGVPPRTEVGLKENALNVAAATFKPAVLAIPA